MRSRTTALPAYDARAERGDAERGKDVYAAACAGCHGPGGGGGPKGGPVTDPSYLSLVSDQYLRTTVIAGRTDLGMPDWRGGPTGPALSGTADLGCGGVARRRAAARARPASGENALMRPRMARALAAAPSGGEDD